jgi:hypothetical protein
MLGHVLEAESQAWRVVDRTLRPAHRLFYDSRKYLRGGPETHAQVQRRRGHRHQSLLASPLVTPMDNTEQIVGSGQTGNTPPSIEAQRNSGLFHCNAG